MHNYATTNAPGSLANKNYAYLDKLQRSKRRLVKVTRVRFKPGYGRIWRAARTSIREITKISSRYQYRLTPKLQWLYLQHRKTPSTQIKLGLDYALMSTHLLPDCWSVNEMFATKSVFLNGITATNQAVQVFVNDFVQLTVSLKFYITLKWLRNWSENRQKRVYRVHFTKNRPSGTDRNFKFVRTLPEWFLDLRLTYRAVPQHFEVDFFTLSAFVLHDSLVSSPTEPTRPNLYEWSYLNMYNWKYIT